MAQQDFKQPSNFNLIIVVAIVAIVAIFSLTLMFQQRTATGQAGSLGFGGGSLSIGPFGGFEAGIGEACGSSDECSSEGCAEGCTVSCTSLCPTCGKQCICHCKLTP